VALRQSGAKINENKEILVEYDFSVGDPSLTL
jgi:hypothetical protein